MYLNAGNGTILNMKRVIGIFDLETASVGKATREWLSAAEKAGRTRYEADEIPLSVILTDLEEKCHAKTAEQTLLILSQLTPKTLSKRGNLSARQLEGTQL